MAKWSKASGKSSGGLWIKNRAEIRKREIWKKNKTEKLFILIGCEKYDKIVV